MTRARSELALTLAGALTLVIFLAWYQGRQQVPGPASPLPLSGTVLRTAPVDLPQVANITMTAPVTSAAELPPAELASDRAFINEVMTTLDARLGALQYFDSPQPIETADAPAAANGAELQPYTFTAYYEAGEAQVNLVLEKEQQRSSLYSFDINVQN